ncbi:MAG: hypothetical protein KKA36_00430 [Gammaproteobacteria bacterium]|nr:hypothetical protein [Gammaproteobacteria bacterium]
MKFDEEKLRRLIDAADESYAAMRSVGDRLNDARQQVNSLKVNISHQRDHFRGQTNPGTVQELRFAESEMDRLQVNYDRLAQRFNERRALATRLEDWAKQVAGRKRPGDDSVLTINGASLT